MRKEHPGKLQNWSITLHSLCIICSLKIFGNDALAKNIFNKVCNLYYIQTFEFSTFFTNISHENIKTCFKQLIHNASYFNNGKPGLQLWVTHELIYQYDSNDKICSLSRTYLPSWKETFFNKSLTTKMYTTTIRLWSALSLSIVSFYSMRQSSYKNLSKTNELQKR